MASCMATARPVLQCMNVVLGSQSLKQLFICDLKAAIVTYNGNPLVLQAYTRCLFMPEIILYGTNTEIRSDDGNGDGDGAYNYDTVVHLCFRSSYFSFDETCDLNDGSVRMDLYLGSRKSTFKIFRRPQYLIYLTVEHVHNERLEIVWWKIKSIRIVLRHEAIAKTCYS